MKAERPKSSRKRYQYIKKPIIINRINVGFGYSQVPKRLVHIFQGDDSMRDNNIYALFVKMLTLSMTANPLFTPGDALNSHVV